MSLFVSENRPDQKATIADQRTNQIESDLGH